MSKVIKKALIAASVALFSLNIYAGEECDSPASPIIPDGNVASEDELVSAQKAIKMFQASMIDYRDCLGAKIDAIDPEAENAAELSAPLNAAHDASVDAESAVAAEFNTAVQAFKARQ